MYYNLNMWLPAVGFALVRAWARAGQCVLAERMCAHMGDVDILKEMERADEAKAREQGFRARRDVQLLLEGQAPQEGEDYGFWRPHLARLLQAFEQGGTWGVQNQLVMMLQDREQRVPMLLRDLEAPDGRLWLEVLRELEAAARRVLAERRMAEQREAAEQRMRERLARSTGDSMADEIMAMLRERDLSRTDIYRRYSRNVSAERINDALFVLERLGWARWTMVSTGGRRREIWSLPPEEE